MPLLALLAACSGTTDDTTADAGTTFDAGTATDAGTPPPVTVTESEPNGGTPKTAVNDWDPATLLAGAIDPAGDADVFKLATVPGRVYRLTLEAPEGSTLDGWLTVMDAGRGTKDPGEDFVKLASDPDAPGARLEFLAMGVGGHYVIVRDKGGAGGATRTYTLKAESLEAASLAARTLSLPETFDDALAHAGALRLYAFDADEGTDVLFDVKRKVAAAGLDLRLFVFNAGQGDLIARNDNRGAGDPNPRLDAPLTAGGRQYLVVENIEEEAGDLAYSVAASLP